MRRWLIPAVLAAAVTFVTANPADVKAQVYSSVVVSPGYGYYGTYAAPGAYVSVAPSFGFSYAPYYSGLSVGYGGGWGGYGYPYYGGYGYRSYYGRGFGWGGYGYGRGYRGWGGYGRRW